MEIEDMQFKLVNKTTGLPYDGVYSASEARLCKTDNMRTERYISQKVLDRLKQLKRDKGK